MAALKLLPVERQKVYVARFATRARMGGWLIRDKLRDEPYFAEILGGLERTQGRAKSFEDARWQLTVRPARHRRPGGSSGAPRGGRTGRRPAPPLTSPAPPSHRRG
jgi:hypothetical protein